MMGQVGGQGALLRAARKERSWRLSDSVAAMQALASELGELPDAVSVNHFGKWERGRSAPNDRNKARLCLIYDKAPEELGFQPVPALRATLDDLTRRRLSRQHAMAHSGTANELSSVVGMTAELAEVISNAAILLGWLNYNMHNRGYANAFWKMALDRAVAGGNRQVHAYVLGIMSCLYSGVPKRGGDRYDTSTPIAMLDQALLISKDTDNHPLRAYLCGRRAEEHAVSGHTKAAFQDLMVGHAILGRALDRNDCAVPILDEWQDARLARYHGSAAQILGDHREARRALRVALETLRPTFLPQRAMIMSDLASVYAQQENPDPERAAGLLCDALDIAQPAGLGEAEMRVVEARRHLDRWSHLPAVKQLDERLRLV